MMTDWFPRLTTAVIVEKNNKLLMVRERTPENVLVMNQPAGHVEYGETVFNAAIRETREETGLNIKLNHFIGLFAAPAIDQKSTYYRLLFHATVESGVLQPLDADIEEACWLSLDEIFSDCTKWRSPIVGKSINAWKKGQRAPLSIITDLSEGAQP